MRRLHSFGKRVPPEPTADAGKRELSSAMVIRWADAMAGVGGYWLLAWIDEIFPNERIRAGYSGSRHECAL